MLKPCREIVDLIIHRYIGEISDIKPVLDGSRGGGAKAMDIGCEGDCDWPAVMQALDDIGYEGWGTAEVSGGDRERLKDIADRMDRLYAM